MFYYQVRSLSQSDHLRQQQNLFHSLMEVTKNSTVCVLQGLQRRSPAVGGRWGSESDQTGLCSQPMLTWECSRSTPPQVSQRHQFSHEFIVQCLFTQTIFTLIDIDKCCVLRRRGHQAGVRWAGCCRQEAVVHQRPGRDSGWKEGVLHRLQQQVAAQELPEPHHGGHSRRTVRQGISSSPSRSESSQAFISVRLYYFILQSGNLI